MDCYQMLFVSLVATTKHLCGGHTKDEEKGIQA